MSTPQRSRNTKSRSVKTLTPDQLARKRANDREAQRINRQNTRKYIEKLEQQVAQFDGKEQQLKEALLRNYQLEMRVAALENHIGQMTAAFPYWRSHGVGGRNDTDGTVVGIPHPLPLLTPGILPGRRPKCDT
jgi:hypothetical protein